MLQEKECAYEFCKKYPEFGNQYCVRCLDRFREYKNRPGRAKEGMCSRCYSHPKAKNRQCCKGCLKKSKRYQKTSPTARLAKIRDRKKLKVNGISKCAKLNEQAKKLGCEGHVSRPELRKLMQDSKGLCFYCGESTGQFPHRDHVIPRGKPIRGPHYIRHEKRI